MRFRLKILFLAITAFAVLAMHYSKTGTSVESAYWGRLIRVPESDVRYSINGLRLWYQQTGSDCLKSLVAVCENEEIDSIETVRALLKDPSSVETIFLARHASPNSALLVATENDDDLLIEIAAITMALDKLHFEIDESKRPDLGGKHPVVVSVKGVGRFDVYYINDWGYYATTRLDGPRTVVAAYDTLARNDNFVRLILREPSHEPKLPRLPSLPLSQVL